MRAYVIASLFLWTLTAWGSLPWTFPSNIQDRISKADLVVAGRVGESTDDGTRIIDGTKVSVHQAVIKVDRVFKGTYAPELKFTWYSLYVSPDQGILYSGPPTADFQPSGRYLVFLKHTKTGWRVSMPVYAIEVKLASTPAGGDALRDFSQASEQARNWAIAEELEKAALALPPPPAGVTGEAPMYFPEVFDLIGGCAESLYRHFVLAPSPELRREAQRWRGILRSKQAQCQTPDGHVHSERELPWN
jgi:hypothetical protein